MSETREERARLIRDRALAVLGGKPTFGDVSGDRLAIWRQGVFTILLRTPFADAPQHDRPNTRMVAEAPRSYGMEIFAPSKVMNVEWGGDDDLLVVTFHPGKWEEKFLSLAAGSPTHVRPQSSVLREDFFGPDTIDE